MPTEREIERPGLLALDLDGTLFGSDLQIAESVRRAIARAQQAGVIVTLATGRSVRGTLPFAKTLQIDAPLICYQGARIQHPTSGEVLLDQPVPGPLAATVVTILSAAGIHVQIYLDDELYVGADRPEIEFYTRLSPVPMPVNVVPHLADLAAQRPPTKIVFIAEEAEVQVWLERLSGEFSSQLSIMRSYPIFGEIAAAECSKGAALAFLAERLGISRQATIAIGDQENDLPMLQWAGLGLAVANAVPAVLAAADRIIPPVWEGGVATAIERYVLSAAHTED